jgi:hypothetical protein
MRPDLIVVSAVNLDHDPCLGAMAEPLHVEALIAEFAVEAFVVTVLPRLAGVDQGGIDLGLGQSLQDRLTHELWAVI